MSGKIPWLVSLIGSLATAELLLSQRPASHCGQDIRAEFFVTFQPKFGSDMEHRV